MKGIRLLLIGSLFFTFSCSKNLVSFTSNLMKENSFKESDLKEIQFYLSKDVVLNRQLGKTESTIEDGEIRVIQGKRVEEIIVKKGTPGIFGGLTSSGNFKIYFDQGDQDYLSFGPNPKRSGNYVLLGQNWDSKKGIVHYGGKKYYTPTYSSYAHLEVDMNKWVQVDKKRKKAKGVTVK